MLAEQFYEAAQEWSRMVNAPSDGIAWYVMACIYEHPTWRLVASDELQGWPSLERMNRCLMKLEQLGKDVVLELVRCVDDSFEKLSEDYAKGIRNRRDAVALDQQLEGHPFLKPTLEEMKQHRDYLIAWRKAASSIE